MKAHDNCPMDSYVQSLDDSLRDLRKTMHDDMILVHGKLDDLSRTTIKRGDCEKCRGDLREMSADKVSKTEMVAIIRTATSIGIVLGLISTWLLLNTNIIKAFGGP